jgi:SAM-dependent methyltransferase
MRTIIEAAEEKNLVLDVIKDAARGGRVRVPEAGCGNHWGLCPEGVELSITGVDLDAEAMRLRQLNYGDLDEMIVGDLRDVDLPVGYFDVVYCSYVLEDVEGAEMVLDRMLAAVRPGGALIVRVPDRDSVFGRVARHTPHRSHVWFKRYVERFPDAGSLATPPYPVVYDAVVSLEGLRSWATRHHHTAELYTTNYLLKKLGPLAPAAMVAFRAMAWLSRGRLAWEWNCLGLVARTAA